MKKKDQTITKETKKNTNKNTKKILKKNQIIIGALTVLLGIAGYINFAGNDIDLSKDKTATSTDMETNSAFAKNDMDVASNEVTYYETMDEENIELNSDEENIGEAVFTSSNVTVSVAGIKLTREQERSKNKELYLEIINGDGMDEDAVNAATDAYLTMTANMEKEAEAETILAAKGFQDVIVSISENGETVDVVVSGNELTGVERAQIEDVITRKCGCTVDQIVITPVG